MCQDEERAVQLLMIKVMRVCLSAVVNADDYQSENWSGNQAGM